MVKVAILGIGVVGGGTAEVLTKNRDLIARRAGSEIEVKYILCRKPRPDHPFAQLIVHDIETVANDPEVKVVAECIGGATLAYEYVKRCLDAGKSVVTSNKELVAEKGLELTALAPEEGVNFLFEASVGGGIPILRPICQCLAANEISSVCGILNGTTNYILTEMMQMGKSFEQALREAQQKGYAEADPTADVEGIDAGRKICILADLCFGKNVSPSAITTEGITKITPADIECARALGYKIKLLGRAMRTGPNSVTAFVAPHLISRSAPAGQRGRRHERHLGARRRGGRGDVLRPRRGQPAHGQRRGGGHHRLRARPPDPHLHGLVAVRARLRHGAGQDILPLDGAHGLAARGHSRGLLRRALHQRAERRAGRVRLRHRLHVRRGAQGQDGRHERAGAIPRAGLTRMAPGI